MSGVRRGWIWFAVLVAAVLSLYLLGSVLLPFVAGLALAYLLDPMVGRLQRQGMSRTLATVAVSLVFTLLFLLAMILLVPVLVGQAADFAKRLPSYGQTLRDLIVPLVDTVREVLPPTIAERLRAAAIDYAAPVANWLARFITGLLGSGIVLVNLLSLVLITPIVAFYLLRDWDKLVQSVDGALPRPHAETIREQVRQVDRTLSGFLRGQAMVCLVLGLYYGIALSLIGMDLGLMVGLVAGLISFIPYLGTGVGFVLAVLLAWAQFGTLSGVGMAAAVFVVGQFVEGNFLTPRLVGDRVGLHPVWVMFALLAGGALFGFVGVLVAVPAAAVIGVAVRFTLQRYRTSTLYLGGDATPGGPPL